MVAKLGNEIIDDIQQMRYKLALNKINSFRKKISKTEKVLDLMLLENHLNFLLDNYSNLHTNLELTIDNINDMKRHSLDEKKYQKLFVYSLIYYSYLLHDENDKAIEIKKIFHKVNYDLDMRNVKKYFQNRYPVYCADMLQKLFGVDGYYKNYSNEKLKSIIDNDVFNENNIIDEIKKIEEEDIKEFRTKM